MKYISLFVLAFLAFASAQNENFIRETSYYSDSQCTAATILSAHALVVDFEGCIEQTCQQVQDTPYFSRIVCRSETILAPVPNQWPLFYLFDTEGCPRNELVDFFYSRPGTCYPINLRNELVFITASCNSFGIGATICNDRCNGNDCFNLNGTESCSFFKFPFADAWVLGECPLTPSGEPAVNTPSLIPAVLIQSAAVSKMAQIVYIAAAAIAVALFILKNFATNAPKADFWFGGIRYVF